MKRCVLTLALIASLGVCAEMMTPQQKAVLNNIVRCESRDTTTMKGFVISTWTRGGKVFRVDTNAVRQVTGVAQKNPLKESLEKAKAELAERIEEIKSIKAAKDEATARLESFRSYLEGKKSEAKLSTTKALYQAIIDKLDGKE